MSYRIVCDAEGCDSWENMPDALPGMPPGVPLGWVEATYVEEMTELMKARVKAEREERRAELMEEMNGVGSVIRSRLIARAGEPEHIRVIVTFCRKHTVKVKPEAMRMIPGGDERSGVGRPRLSVR